MFSVHVHDNYTGRFIMFSMITNIYNKKTKGPTLMELLTATGKLKKVFLTTRNVRWVQHGWHGRHRYCIDILHCYNDPCLGSIHPYWRLCGKNLNIVSMCAVSPVVHTSNISSCQKNFFSVSVAVNNSINPLTPNGHYSGRTAPLTSRRCILNIYSTNIRTEYCKHAA
jgi:hypothetical protein